jgi:hypothetical protein
MGCGRNISKVPVVYITESFELHTSDSSLRYSTRNTLSYYFEVRRSKYTYIQFTHSIQPKALFSIHTNRWRHNTVKKEPFIAKVFFNFIGPL